MSATEVDGGATTTGNVTATRLHDSTAVVEQEIKRKDYRVFKRDPLVNDDSGDPMWRDLGDTTFEGKYAAYPTAERLGHLWGEGHYLHFPTEGYGNAEFLTVVADTVYRQAEEGE